MHIRMSDRGGVGGKTWPIARGQSTLANFVKNSKVWVLLSATPLAKEPCAMEPYILFALLLIGPVEPLPQHGREVARSAEFTSLGSCNEAGLALGKKFNSPPGQRQFVFAAEFVCVKK